MDRLKLGDGHETQHINKYLHSNMDRLKRYWIDADNRDSVIYIPIWID